MKLSTGGAETTCSGKNSSQLPLPLLTTILFLMILLAPSAHAELEMLPYGNVTASLVNGLTGQPIPHEEVYLNRIESDGKYTHVATKFTDHRGLVGFQVDELGTGATFILRIRPFNGGMIDSRSFSSAGVFQFEVGLLPITVVSGDGGGLLADKLVLLRERMADGSQVTKKSGYTDASGMIVFDAPDIGEGHNYVVWAKSPQNGVWKQSPPIVSKDAMTFTVGNSPLNVTLVNGLSNKPLAGMPITALEKLADGSLKWAAKQVTDTNGHAVFDLYGLGSDRTYILRAYPYNGGHVTTPEISATGDITFEVGRVPVTLKDHQTGKTLPNRELVAYEKTPAGKLIWKKKGTTDEKGVVRFDLEGLTDGNVHIIRAYNPFGDGNRYYSSLITHTGPVEMSIEPGQSHNLDRSPPAVTIISPADGAEVSDNGFTITGHANDKEQITEVIVKITDPVKGITENRARYNPIGGYWRYVIDAASITTGKSVIAEVSAIDDSLNIGSASHQYFVIDDNSLPELDITSHQDGDRVFNNGFLVSGTLWDNTGVTRLTATVNDSTLGLTVNEREIETASDGIWNLVIRDGEVSADADVDITVSAHDAAGNVRTKKLLLHTLSSQLNAFQLVNRITFGATPALVNRIQDIGPAAYLAEQLNPASIDDSELESRLAEEIGEITSRTQLENNQLKRAIFSKRQLLVVMTWFWENHFNTDIRKTRVEWELADNSNFTEHALGYFRDLLEVSATSPAMLRYLDNVYSYKQEPNENYARELLELHTLGVDGGYTQQDVVEVARTFTGWRYKDGVFDFQQWAHDTGDKVVLGHLIPSGGIEEGESILDILAEHPSTAGFICTKLIQKFLADKPAADSVNSCATVFHTSGGHIAAVLEHILRTPLFNSEKHYHKKVKTPFEFVAGTIRNFEAVPGVNDLRYALRNMGMPLFQNPIPTGWAETGGAWTDSNQQMQRHQFTSSAAFRDINDTYTHMMLLDLFRDHNIATAEGVLGYLFQVALGNDYSQLEWDTAIGVLTMNGNVPFDIYAEDAKDRLQALVALVTSYPNYHLQ